MISKDDLLRIDSNPITIDDFGTVYNILGTAFNFIIKYADNMFDDYKVDFCVQDLLFSNEDPYSYTTIIPNIQSLEDIVSYLNMISKQIQEDVNGEDIY